MHMLRMRTSHMYQYGPYVNKYCFHRAVNGLQVNRKFFTHKDTQLSRVVYLNNNSASLEDGQSQIWMGFQPASCNCPLARALTPAIHLIQTLYTIHVLYQPRPLYVQYMCQLMCCKLQLQIQCMCVCMCLFDSVTLLQCAECTRVSDGIMFVCYGSIQSGTCL